MKRMAHYEMKINTIFLFGPCTVIPAFVALYEYNPTARELTLVMPLVFSAMILFLFSSLRWVVVGFVLGIVVSVACFVIGYYCDVLTADHAYVISFIAIIFLPGILGAARKNITMTVCVYLPVISLLFVAASLLARVPAGEDRWGCFATNSLAAGSGMVIAAIGRFVVWWQKRSLLFTMIGVGYGFFVGFLLAAVCYLAMAVLLRTLFSYPEELSKEDSLLIVVPSLLALLGSMVLGGFLGGAYGPQRTQRAPTL
jgi:hypothetical protein